MYQRIDITIPNCLCFYISFVYIYASEMKGLTLFVQKTITWILVVFLNIFDDTSLS